MNPKLTSNVNGILNRNQRITRYPNRYRPQRNRNKTLLYQEGQAPLNFLPLHGQAPLNRTQRDQGSKSKYLRSNRTPTAQQPSLHPSNRVLHQQKRTQKPVTPQVQASFCHHRLRALARSSAQVHRDRQILLRDHIHPRSKITNHIAAITIWIHQCPHCRLALWRTVYFLRLQPSTQKDGLVVQEERVICFPVL